MFGLSKFTDIFYASGMIITIANQLSIHKFQGRILLAIVILHMASVSLAL